MIPFAKAHACGNDFLVIDEVFAQGQHAELALQLCQRNTGIGADGIEFLDRRLPDAPRLRLFNSDGREAELSGNGTRCVAAWLAHTQGLKQVSFDTLAGARSCRVLHAEGARFRIETAMGVPTVEARTIQVAGIGEVQGAVVSVGNPHFVLFPESPEFAAHGLSWQELGHRISTDGQFPQGTNVEFVQLLTPEAIAFRIFERGCGPTASSGTGSCAAAAAAIDLRGAARELSVEAEGGTQHVVWPSDGEAMRLTGPAEIICTGEAFWP